MRHTELLAAAILTLGCAEPATAPRAGALLLQHDAPNAGSPGQASRISAPADDYLLEMTELAARRSELGELRSAAFGSDELELRFWGGYGLVGTSGLIVRRRGGKWSASHVDMKRCSLTVPFHGSDSVSDADAAYYEQVAFDRCEEPDVSGTSGWWFTADRLIITPARTPSQMAALWDAAIREGLLLLPKEVPRAWVMTDGHSFVIEVRSREEYRATVIECLAGSKVREDLQVQRLVKLFHAAFPNEWELQCE
jgi:hypothetical protein